MFITKQNKILGKFVKKEHLQIVIIWLPNTATKATTKAMGMLCLPRPCSGFRGSDCQCILSLITCSCSRFVEYWAKIGSEENVTLCHRPTCRKEGVLLDYSIDGGMFHHSIQLELNLTLYTVKLETDTRGQKFGVNNICYLCNQYGCINLIKSDIYNDFK